LQIFVQSRKHLQVKYKHVAFIRFCVSLLLSIIALVICAELKLGWGNCFELGWIVFGITYLIQGITTMLRIQSTQIKNHAKDEDLGVWFQFGIMIACCSISLFAVIVWNENVSIPYLPNSFLFITSVALSWFIVHLSFTFRYAHLYYGDLNQKYSKHAKGLDFPEEENPDYLDFAYYSYTIGMTFQVSDVTVKTKGLRRLTLVHSLLSFVFNTILVALTINEILK